VIATSVLEPWVQLRSWLSERTPLPDLTRTWIELLPSAAPDVDSPTELDAIHDWLCLAATVRWRLPELAAELDFPMRYRSALENLVASAAKAGDVVEPPQTAALLARVLDRLADAAPEVAPDVVAHTTARLRWTVGPLDDPPPPRSRGRTVEGPTIVDRILDDLG